MQSGLEGVVFCNLLDWGGGSVKTTCVYWAYMWVYLCLHVSSCVYMHACVCVRMHACCIRRVCEGKLQGYHVIMGFTK